VVDGEVVEAGRHEELLARRGPYRRLYELQFDVAVGQIAGGEVEAS
jgi:ABC-type multidrug transport system fused ATPase/permease subunit